MLSTHDANPELHLGRELWSHPAGRVYAALRDGRPCVVRRLPQALPGADRARRCRALQRDALTLARLGTPGLPRVLEVLQYEGEPAVVMVEVPAPALAAFLVHTPSAEHVLGIVAALAAQLHALHGAGLVHGDLGAHAVCVSQGAKAHLLDTGALGSPGAGVFGAAEGDDLRALALLCRAHLLPALQVAGAPDRVVALRRAVAQLAAGQRAGLVALQAYRNAVVRTPSLEGQPQRPEYDALLQGLMAAPQQGITLVELLGHAGTGKTYLVQQLAIEAERRGRDVLTVKCRADEWLPFAAMQRLLEGHLQHLDVLPPAARDEAWQRLRGAIAGAEPVVSLLSPRLREVVGEVAQWRPVADAQEAFVERLADAAARYLCVLRAPLVVVDDVQWLDASSRRVLSRMVARLSGSSAMLVFSGRHTEAHRHACDRLRHALPAGALSRIELGAMSPTASAALVASYLGLSGPPPEALVSAVMQAGDGSPLSMIEVLRRALADGRLGPRWGVWQLQVGSDAGISGQPSADGIGALDDVALRVMEAAAVVGSPADLELLGTITAQPRDRVEQALRDAHIAGLLSIAEEGGFAFCHDSVPEALEQGLTPAQCAALHDRAAEALRARAPGAGEHSYRLARHYACGNASTAPEAAFRACWDAARKGIARYDDAQALPFLEAAQRAAQAGGFDPGARFHLDLAEVALRLGANARSLRAFEAALGDASDAATRAHIWTRIAWLRQDGAAPDDASAVLQRAFDALGVPAPDGAPRGLVRAALGLAASALVARLPFAPSLDGELRRRVDALCDAYFRAARLAIENNQPQRFLHGVVELTRAAKRLGPSLALVRGYSLLGFVLTLLGARGQGGALIEHARDMADRLEDPRAQTWCAQMAHVVAGWAGDSAEMERLGHLCLQRYGVYMETTEFCAVAHGIYVSQLLRGLPRGALAALQGPIERVVQTGHAPPQFELLAAAARTQLLVLGREDEADALRRRLASVPRTRLQPGHYLWLWAAHDRLMRLLDTEQLDAFEAEAEAFFGCEVEPENAHVLAVTAYVPIGHYWLHRILCGDTSAGDRAESQLRRVCDDLQKAARVNLLKAHLQYLLAGRAFVAGDADAMQAALTEAERLARLEHCPWVLYSVARLRGHALRAEGRFAAARTQGQLALMLARQSGHRARQRWVRQELLERDEAEAWETAAAERQDDVRMRRQLDALLHISRAGTRELGPEQLSQQVLGELVRTVCAERGFLWLRERGGRRLVLRAVIDLSARAPGRGTPPPYDQAVVDRVYATGRLQTSAERSGLRPARSLTAVPLLLHEEVVGVVYLDAPHAHGAFHTADVEVLQALANQVPVALELADALRQRERLERELQHAHKMEALGRVAGGIAHDFNSILGTIKLCTAALEEGQARAEVRDILAATERGAGLAKQLLTFARRQVREPEPCDVHAIVQGLLPMLRRLVGDAVRIETALLAREACVLGDRSQLEQVLLNLVANARDAVGDGGCIRVTTGAFYNHAGGHPDLDVGPHLLLTVADDGAGMTDEVRNRLFEPLFSTKADTHGTGLGLSTVYGIVQQARGRIEVDTALGEGSEFRLFLPVFQVSVGAAAAPQRRDALPAPELPAEGARQSVVLVVDDDEILRRAMARTLESDGLRVLSAVDAEQALRLLREFSGPIDLVVSDLRMPDMDGDALIAAMPAQREHTRALLVSGQEHHADLDGQLQRGRVEYLQKPFEADVLVERVRALLSAPDAGA